MTCIAAEVAEKVFRKVKHREVIRGVLKGVRYIDGIEVKTKAAA